MSSDAQKFALSLTNTGSTPCELVVAPFYFTLAITSGIDPIWTTADCSTWVPRKTVTLEPSQSHKFSLAWPIARSSGTCKISKTKLKPGTYVATATWTNYGATSARQVMDLTA